MVKTLLLTLILVGIAVILLAIGVIVKKNGKFPETHIGKNKAMAERGIKCNVLQDREAQKTNNKNF